jgi:hypothetical protein
VMRGHLMALAAFLTQPDPPALALGVVVLDAHGDDGADTGEGEGHDADQRPVAQPDHGRDIDAVRQLACLFGVQHRGLAGLDDVLRAPDRVRRVGGHDLAGDQPVEHHADGGKVLLDRGFLEAPKLMNELATALILRAVASDPGRVDQIRRYLRHAVGKSVRSAAWESTGRATDQLVKEALAEVRNALGADEPGSSSLELAVRGAYPLVVSGRLNADRGSANNEQPDRRTPGEVLDAMRRSIQGIHQLGQALRDFADDKPVIRAVDEDGDVKQLADGSADQEINDIYLRNEFPPLGKVKAAKPGDTPVDRYNRALSAFGGALQALENAFDGLTKVSGDDGQPSIESRGVEPRLSEPWRELLGRIDDEMIVWARAFKKAHGTKASPSAGREANDEAKDADPYAEAEDEAENNWDRPETVAEGEVAA